MASGGKIQIFFESGNTQSKSAETLNSNDGVQTASTEMEGDKRLSQSKGKYSLFDAVTDGSKVELKTEELQRGESQSSEDMYQLQGKEAALACHFFERELIEMDDDCDCQTVRVPAVGRPETVTIKCQKAYTKKKFEGRFEKMKLEIQSFSSQEVPFSEDKTETVKQFIKENTSRDVLLYCNPKENQTVFIYSKDSNKMTNICHRLKLELGIIKPSMRRGRVQSFENDGNMSGKGNFDDIPSSSLYPDISSLEEYSDTDFDFRLSGNLLVKVYEGSITRVKVDAIVNAANESLFHAGGVARVIEDAAGRELTVESRKYIERNGYLKVGDVCLTTAGKLQYKSVMHAFGPQWHMYSNKSECLKDLYATIYAVLEKADKEEYEKIAMPAISAGIFGVPKELCTDMYVNAAVKYSEDRKTRQTFLRELHIVDLDTKILQDVRASWEKWQKSPQAIEPWKVADEYAKKHSSFYQYYGQSHRGHHEGATTSSSMKSTDSEETRRGETLRLVDMGKEVKFGHTMQKFQLGQELAIHIYKGSLVDISYLDALITSISTKGEKGQLGNFVAETGGRIYQKSFNDETRGKYLTPGDIFKCKPGKIRAGYIINVVIDRLQSVYRSELDKYQCIILTLLKNINDLKDVKTIAMPLLGSGSLMNHSSDLDRCCSKFVQAVLDFCRDEKKPNIKEIHIVNTDENVCKSVEKAFRSASTKFQSNF
ncbi:hypothetical protein ACJMK2_006172 [Sinanodonta woodiana]|uniref:Macro domain-containing protein n=1 Tax=Sinanodonta woodiana TaxID=1069815 RepID=A0ABD3VSB2_SINWO